MKKQLTEQIDNKTRYSLRMVFVLFFAFISFMGAQLAHAEFGPATRYESESSNLGNVATSSANAGYSGSGYVTNLISEWSYISFDKSNSSNVTARLDIRYANGTGAAVNNLALFIGSSKIQTLSFPTTANWTTWSTLSVTFTLPGGYQSIKIKGEVNVTSSVNIDYSDLSLDDGSVSVSVATPTFTPVAGTYTSAQSVSISSPTSGATIYYTTDGTTPTTSSAVYSSSINVGSTQTIKALAVKSGLTNSPVSSATYTINIAPSIVATPTFSPAAGTYTSAQSVTISTAASGSTFYYTTDGTTPTTSSSVYSGAVSVSSSKTLKALATASGMTNSAIGSAAYTINIAPSIVATPTFSPGAGTYTSAQSVTISTTTSGATIYYTIDGTTPTTSSSVYTSALSVGSNQTLKALATASGMTNSTIGSASYTINTGGGTGNGNITRDYFAGISGTSVSNLTSNSNFPNNPTSTSLLNQFQSPTNVADDYGQRVYGYVTAPSTGSYTFWISSDDDSELWLSTDGSSSNKVKIASVTGWTNTVEWNKYPSQTSASISLTAGTQYFIEALQKEGGGGDNLAVAWQVPGGSRVIIPGSALSTFLSGTTPAPGSFTQSAPASGATGVSATPTFSWAASSNAVSYALVVSTSSSYTSPVINQTSLTGTSYTPTTALANSTVYFWKVSATNATGSTIATNAGISFTTVAIAPSTVATPTFTPVAGTYSSTQLVSIGTTTSGATIYYTTDGTTPTTSSSVYTASLSVSSSQTVQAIAAKSGMTTSAVASAAYTISVPPPAPGSFSQTAPASGATSVSSTPTFTWASSSNAATYSLVVSTNSSYTSPAINQTGLTTTSYGSGTLSASTTYYWKVTAVNATGSTVATNAGISFTTGAAATVGSGPGYIYREYWNGITGQAVSDLTSSPIFAGAPTGTSNLNTFEAPRNFGDNYGQRIKGYLAPTVSGAYTFYIASDNDSELWLSTNSQASNKVKIAYVLAGYNSPQEWTKYASQKSATVNLTAGNLYYIEALHKEADQGDNVAVGWVVPGSSTTVVIPGDNLSTYIPSLPNLFTQTTPAGGATGISTNPTFVWNASSGAQTYSLVVSTSSSYGSPVINQSGITSTSYSYSGSALPNNTQYYWKVTATNIAGSVVATNAGISFTTAAATPPVSFNQTAPAGGATGVSWTPNFTWDASANANSYTLVVSTNSSYASPAINQSGITLTNYTPSTNLSATTVYYWKVSAVNAQGSTIASNAGLSFTTAAAPPAGSTFYVTTTGSDASGNGSSGSPWRTVAYAASQVTGSNKTINVGPGTFSETQAIVLGLGVSLKGAGESATTITSAAAIPSPGFDESTPDWKLMYHGSLIQLISAGYSGASPYYGDPALMIASSDGNQTISDMTLDGNAKTIKAGVWMLNRNNVVVHHVTFKNFKMRGAVLARSDMWWYVELGKWITGTKVYNCTFTNSGSDISQESLGNLCLAGLDGADIYNNTINESQGYGIKFIYVGHFRNLKIHDCTIAVPEFDPLWSEDITMELWNLDYGNEIYNITCNTWLSIVNHKNIYDKNPANVTNVYIHNVKMVDNDGISQKEAIECATPNMTISDCYFKDKGIGMAVWMEGKQNMTIKNNIFYNATDHSSNWAAGAGVYVPDVVNGLNIYNNVFEYYGTTIHMKGNVTNCNIKNNVFINPIVEDVYSPNNSFNFSNNIKYTADNLPWKIEGGATLSNNYLANPGFKYVGNRFDTYYQPASGSSFAVDKGVNVGLPYSGTAPDIGRWEFGLTSNRELTSASSEVDLGDNVIGTYPNPTTGIIKVSSSPDVIVLGVQVSNLQGKTLISKSAGELKSGEIDLSAYPNDIYILSVKHQRGLITKKVALVK